MNVIYKKEIVTQDQRLGERAQSTIDAQRFHLPFRNTASAWNLPPTMSRRPFRLGRSLTGLGLFATRPIKKRSRIAEYKGPLLTTKEAEKAEARGNRYLYEINSRWTIDGTPRSNIARYANHSCNPNSETYDVKHRVFIRALRNIKPGEEIVYDYGIDYLKNVIGRSNCKCSRCRRRRARRASELRQKRRQHEARLASARKTARQLRARTAKPRKKGR
jgi:SET domain-containing protein